MEYHAFGIISYGFLAFLSECKHLILFPGKEGRQRNITWFVVFRATLLEDLFRIRPSIFGRDSLKYGGNFHLYGMTGGGLTFPSSQAYQIHLLFINVASACARVLVLVQRFPPAYRWVLHLSLFCHLEVVHLIYRVHIGELWSGYFFRDPCFFRVTGAWPENDDVGIWYGLDPTKRKLLDQPFRGLSTGTLDLKELRSGTPRNEV